MISMAAKREQDAEPFAERRNRVGVVGNDVRFVAERAFVRAGFADSTLVLRWSEIAGAEVASLARPVKLAEGPSGGVLTLKAEPAASVFLQHETRTLCDRINAYLGRPAVHRLRFVYGTLQAAKPEPSPTPAFLKEAPAEDATRRFEGPESLKSALLALARARANRSSGD
jgi:hypothetical protein